MKAYLLKTIILLIVTWVFFPIVNAQEGDTLFIQRGEKGKIEFARFKVNANSNRKMKNDTVFLKSILNAKKEDGFRLKSVITDEMGMTHRKFQQYYKGIPVDNAEYLVHGINDDIEAINGDFQDINIDRITPILSERQALAKALEYVGAKKYKWEDSDMEKSIKQQDNNPNATYYPEGELVVAKDYMTVSNVFKLSWKFTISSLEPNNEQIIFVDAAKGEIIRDIPLILDTNTSGSAQTWYSGPQTITCDSYSGGYRLYENRTLPISGGTVTISTKNCLNNTNTGSSTEFTNTSTSWTSVSWATFAQNQAALDVHWAVEKVLDYWSSVHLRKSLDNSGLGINGYAHYNSGWNNAEWDQKNKEMHYGDGDGTNYNPFTSIDVIAHEMGHGITQFTANLTYGNFESGALNEGFSDIWATCVKAWAAPNKSKWLLGGEIVRNSLYNCIRNIQTPSSPLSAEGLGIILHPSRYQGTNWNTANEPHYNSTVLSHWFYLLSEGGSGNNDGITFDVVSIGIGKAERIAYKALTSYLNSSANYTAARNATISAAISLYGSLSQEVVSVTNAWHAVGVGDRFPPTITGPLVVCFNSQTTFSVTNAPSGFIWASSSNIILTGGSGNTIKATAAGNTGPGWISIKVGNVELARVKCYAGAPIYTDFYALVSPDNIGQAIWDDGVLYDRGNYPVDYYQWSFGNNYGWTVQEQKSPDGISMARVIIIGNGPTDVYVSAYNSCGCGGIVYAGSTSSYFSPSFFLYPNPASSILNIEIKDDAVAINDMQAASASTVTDAQQSEAAHPHYTIRLYDNFGNMQRHTTAKKGDKVHFNVSHLKSGIYYLHIYDGVHEKPEIHQVIISHK